VGTQTPRRPGEVTEPAHGQPAHGQPAHGQPGHDSEHLGRLPGTEQPADARDGSEVVDLLIVGGGPAGSAAALRALQLRPDANVVIVDAAAFPRDKACGDGIAPHGLDVLRSLGMYDAVAGFTPVDRMRLSTPGGAEVATPSARANYVVPRETFDARLLSAACARGARLVRRRVRSLHVGERRGAGGAAEPVVVVDGELHAKVVVGADGANSAVRRALGIGPNPPEALAIAVRGYADAPPGGRLPEQLIQMTDEGWPAYAWSFPIGDGRANIGYGMLRSRLGDGERGGRAGGGVGGGGGGGVGGDSGGGGGRIGDTPALGIVGGQGSAPTMNGSRNTGTSGNSGKSGKQILHQTLARMLPDQPAYPGTLRAHHLPMSTWRPRQPDGPVLLAGDAASLINPLTGEGIYYALLSGSLAGAVAVTEPAGRAGAAYRSELDNALGRHLRHTALLAGLAGRNRPLMDAAVRAASRRTELYDTLVEIGLGRGTIPAASLIRLALRKALHLPGSRR
jgi:flavin-dependent dehydrogenase